MHKDKNMLQATLPAGEYLAPSVGVMEINARQVICGSDQDSLYGGFSNGEQEGY